MESIEVEGAVRTIAEHSPEQTRALRAIRKDDGTPYVPYGVDENVHFIIPAEGLRNLVYALHTYVVGLVIGGKKVSAILRDIQFHPVKDATLHVDPYRIDEAKPTAMKAPVQMEGLAGGVKVGGKLTLQMHKPKVRVLYNAVPEKLVVNVSHLGLGRIIKVGESGCKGLELLNAREAVICAVKLTRAARGVAVTAASN